MKRIITLLALCLAATIARAQTTNTVTNTVSATVSNTTPTQAADIIVGGLENGASNWVDGVEGLYAAHAKEKFGAMGVIGYKVNPYVYVGAHIEYINDLPTYGGGQVTAGLPFHPLAGYVGKIPKWATDIVDTPWAFVGSGTSFGNGKPTTVVGEAAAGDEIGLWRSDSGTFGIGLNGGVGKRTDITGPLYIGGINFTVNL